MNDRLDITYEKALKIFSDWRTEAETGVISKEYTNIKEKDIASTAAKRFIKDLTRLTINIRI